MSRRQIQKYIRQNFRHVRHKTSSVFPEDSSSKKNIERCKLNRIFLKQNFICNKMTQDLFDRDLKKPCLECLVGVANAFLNVYCTL